LDDSVDLDTAKSIAFLLASSCEALSIQVKDTREIILGCTTIIPDTKSLWAVTPYMIQFLVRAMDIFCKRYEKEAKDN
jgi:hypothetical protein